MRLPLPAWLCLALLIGACAPPHARPPSTLTAIAQDSTAFTHAARPTATPVVRPGLLVRPAPTATPVVPLLDGLLDTLLPDNSGYGLVLEDLGTGARTAVNETASFPSASLYKLGLAWVVLRHVDSGTLALEAPLEIVDDDAIEPEPDGGLSVGDTPTVRDALGAMLTLSSNASAHALLRLVGRPVFAAEMDRLGLTETRLPDDGLAVTSGADMGRLLRLIATSADLSVSSRGLMAEDMANVAPPDALRDTLPDGVSIFDKTGNLEDASNVGALLESPRATAILVVVDTGVDPGDARTIIAQAGMIAYRALLQ